MRGLALVLAALVGAVAAGVTSAASGRTTLEFSTAPLAPKSAFKAITGGNHPGSGRVVLSARARQVAAVHWLSERTLLVAPIRGGGFCTSLSGPYGGTGCRTRRVAVDPGVVGDASGPIALDGSITIPGAQRLELRYEDGSRTTVPFVWVTAPIRAGFFVFPISRAHRKVDHRPLSLSIYSGTGVRLSTTKLHQP